VNLQCTSVRPSVGTVRPPVLQSHLVSVPWIHTHLCLWTQGMSRFPSLYLTSGFTYVNLTSLQLRIFHSYLELFPTPPCLSPSMSIVICYPAWLKEDDRLPFLPILAGQINHVVPPECWSHNSTTRQLGNIWIKPQPKITLVFSVNSLFLKLTILNKPTSSVTPIVRAPCFVFLKFKGYEPNVKQPIIEMFADADFAGTWNKQETEDPSSVRSRSGYVIWYAGCPLA